METASISLGAYAHLLKCNRNFRLLWCAQIVSELGDWLYSVAIYSRLLEVTGSAQSVAFAFVLQVLPQVFVAPAAGVLNDRLSRKQVMIFADWARALITFSMLFVQSREMIWILYLLLFLETVFWALFEPGRNSVIPNITSSRSEMLIANALSATTWAFNLAIGSAVGGLLAAVFGRDTVFVINAFTFVFSALLLRGMRFSEPHLAEARTFRARELADFSPILEGIRYVRQDPRRLATLFVKTGISFMGTNWVLLPIYGERLFPLYIGGLDPTAAGMLGMSALMGARGVGALLGPLAATTWTGSVERRYRVGIIFGFLLGTIGYLALSGAPGLWAAVLAVVVAHSGGSIAWVFSTTLMQIYTDDKFRGRIFSAEQAFSMGTLSVFTYTAGLLADSGVSVRTLAAVTGMMVLIPAVAWTAAQRLWVHRS
jgi:MFS family permease